MLVILCSETVIVKQKGRQRHQVLSWGTTVKQSGESILSVHVIGDRKQVSEISASRQDQQK